MIPTGASISGALYKRLYDFSEVHQTKHECISRAENAQHLISILDDENRSLTSNWRNKSESETTIDRMNLRSWFPKDDRAAFYKTSTSDDGSLDKLTYRQLHEQIRVCPPWMNTTPPSNSDGADLESMFVVAIILPNSMMAEMGVVLLSGMSCSGIVCAPLKPNMSPSRMFEAMDKLKCSMIL